MRVKAVVYLEVPEWQIGQDVTVYFPDAMEAKGKCIAVKTKSKPEKLLPCKGGFEIGGKNEIDVHKKWNEAIKT